MLSETFSHKLALVVGVTAYDGRRLKNAAADARGMAQELRGPAGFTLIGDQPLINPTINKLRLSIEEFATRSNASPAPLVLFYFAGHGVFSRGKHMMLAKDWDGKDDTVHVYGYSTEDLVEALRAERVILLLDTCRAVAMRGGDRGFGWGEPIVRGSSATPWSKVLVAHACAQGAYAADGGAAGHGVYTGYLKQHLFAASAGLPVHQAISKANAAVARQTSEQQVPRMEITDVDNFSFCLVKTAAAAGGAPAVESESAIAAKPPGGMPLPLDEECCACPDVLASDWLFTLSCVFFATISLGLVVTGLIPLNCPISTGTGATPPCKYIPEVSGPFVSVGGVMLLLFCLHAWYFARKRHERLMARRLRSQYV